jgi:hypothetical protein
MNAYARGMRLVSLLPSATEIVYALGLGLDTSGMTPGDIVVRPGPRLVNGVEALAAVIHPDAATGAGPRSGRAGWWCAGRTG